MLACGYNPNLLCQTGSTMPELNAHALLQHLPLRSDHQVVLALSGGLDSMVLLQLLTEARTLVPFSLHAVYIHHGISRYASDWGAFCAAQCARRHIRFSQREVTLSGQDNLEFKARSARYKALAEFIVSPRHLLLTAHHADDQFESLLLALKRGAGVAGLSGIRPLRTFSAGQLARPLLAFGRQQLQQYASDRQLSFVEDDSNTDLRFERNFIRHQITPLLVKRWPHFIRTVSRTMDNMQQSQQLLDDYAQADYQRCVVDDKLLLAELGRLNAAQQNYIIRRWLNRWQLNPSAQWLDTLQRDVIAARDDASPVLQLQQYQLRRFANSLYLLSAQECTAPDTSLIWQGEAELPLPARCGALHFQRQKTTAALPLSSSTADIVFGQLSLSFKPHGVLHSKPLKQWFKLWQVPPWQRQRIPLLVVDGSLQLVSGHAAAISAEQAAYWVSWQA